jgi:hypothetical protein
MEVRIFKGGAEFAGQASEILREAWLPPALNYTQEYMRWQLSFPSVAPMPAAVAFDDGKAVGFGAVTARRLRLGSHTWHGGVASFVAVRPGARTPFAAVALYREFFRGIRELGEPIVTFGIQGAIGPAIFIRAYANAGFETKELGAYVTYSHLVSPARLCGGNWEVESGAGPDALAGIIEACARDEQTIFSDPTPEQLNHYGSDPRPRTLAVVRHRNTGALAAAWAVQAEVLTSRGVATVLSLDSVYVPGNDASALPALFYAAAAWAQCHDPVVITAPNLAGYDPARLRALGIRGTGAPFVGYACSVGAPAFLAPARATNVEIV